MNIIERLETWKNFDGTMSLVLQDAINEIEMLRSEVTRLRNHNERLLQVIYQNHEGLENDS